MTWRADAPQGNESAKVRFDLVPYMGGTVLDLGCGVEKVYPTAIGVDNEVDRKLFGHPVKADIRVDTCERLALFADGSVDTVFSSHLLEHIVDARAALQEWWRLVRVGGYLALYLPHRDHYPRMGQPGSNPDHKHDFAPEDITKMMLELALKPPFHGWDQVENETRVTGVEYSFLQVYQKRADSNVFHYRPRVRPSKTLGLVRLGGYGDALWCSSVLQHFKDEGYHITLYTQPQGEEVLRHDPRIDRIICQPHGLFAMSDGLIEAWQEAYWMHEQKKYDLFINTIGAVERRLLPNPSVMDFYLAFEQRHRLMNRNYMEALHEWCGVPFKRDAAVQRFYPDAGELEWAGAERARIGAPLVLINPAGTSPAKWWPHAQELADSLASEGVEAWIVGDLRMVKFRGSRRVKVVGTDLPLRKLLTLAQLATAVVGTESVLVNAVAYAPPLKVVLLSHSSHENLTRDWHNTIAVEPEGLACYPCHRIHRDFTHCTVDAEAGAAACQAAAKASLVFEHVMKEVVRWSTGSTQEAA